MEPSVSDEDPVRDEQAAPSGRLVAHVEQYPDSPDECTIFPSGVDDQALVTHWLSAEEGSFVALSSMR